MNKSCKIYLVRHGQTDLNREKVFRGRLDPPLNKVGHDEARATGAFMKQFDISHVMSSPLLRAMQTAEPIARLSGLEVEIVRDLIDIDFGKWQGMQERKVQKRYPRLLSRWQKEPHKVTFPAGENLLKVKKRLVSLVELLKTRHADCSVAVVTHRVVCKVLVCMLADIPLKNFWNILVDTAGISLFEIGEERTVLHRLNDTHHLAKLNKGRVTHDF
jgi:broad specificity phosphatase PhoE